ncbi:hypothetical protein GCM10022225_00980 [Plantactinospora mayteni]|uniref:ABC transporter permease n=1 Tax=Plantactinospora mayteni TaxID=566021 RepID=A0ABQ4EYE5_9ACTN|nr:hypothetical protein [Plantactinospora mayteni]GIG99674.1 hypothetical protein Pma05_62470 [Plantactinospora mayteni]
MNRLLRAELRKVLGTPLTWWLLLGTAAIGVLGTIAPLIAMDGRPVDLLTDTQLRTALHGAAGGSVLVIVVGIVGMAGEWRYGQAAQAFLTSPRRWRVVLAKGVLQLGVGLGYGLVAALGSAVAAWIWYDRKGLTLPVERPAVWLTLLGCVAVAGLFGLLGVAVGAAVRRQVPALVGTLAWLVLVEPALFAAVPAVSRWLPGVASLALRGQPADDLLPPVTAAAVLLGTITVALAVGLRMVERDDVTS